MKILTAAEIREIDRLSTDQFGIPGILLMENAGMRVVEALENIVEDLESLTVAILCGKGNNGGDGFVVARQLIQKGCYPFIFLFGSEDEVKGDARVNLDILRKIGSPPTVILTEEEWSQEKLEVLDADLIIDALLGTGLSKPVSGLYAGVIDTLSDDFPRATIVSIDVPSGLPADSNALIGPAVQADVTVTFTALKLCLTLPPAHRYAGDVIVSDIGNPAQLLEGEQFKLSLITEETFPGAHHQRAEESNKGDYGKILIIGGSRGKSGAAAMAGQAALRSGAGLVTVATTESVLPMIAASMPELMTEPLQETAAGTIARQSIAKLTDGKTLLAIGPGLTTHPDTREFVRSVIREASIPVVVDADGLNAFVGGDKELGNGVVITPHPGEMARLIGKDVDFVISNRLTVAADFATSHNVYVVLKGFRTLIATPDGSVFINPTGNPGMATGGTGDILTGMIAGILSQEYLGSFVERLCLAVYLHGLAGDLAAEELGEESLVATDLMHFLPRAWKKTLAADDANDAN
jgi:ADP-dependent NAD(P)H-hydrate dehydratase / NAD(P)H-hydrate epimerase